MTPTNLSNHSRSKFGVERSCVYSEGVVSHSPGLLAQRATLGIRSMIDRTPTGFRHP